MAYDEALAKQQERAEQLSKDRHCPHCARPITLLDVLSMARGHGTVYYVRIELRSGTRMLIREGDFNPQTMLWANEGARPNGAKNS